MITLNELNKFLNSIYKPSDFVDYCINGLYLEGSCKNIDRICTCVTANRNSIDFAISSGSQVIISHHPLLWKSDGFLPVGILSEKLNDIYKHGISMYVAHFPMDANQDMGNNWPVARMIGLQNLRGIFKDSACGMHWGVIGELEKAITAKSLLDMVTDLYSVNPRFACSDLELEIKSVAICSGGAHRFFKEAVDNGADAYICGTGDISQYDLAIENNKLFISIGHFASEKIGPKLLSDFLNEKLSVESIFFDEPNKF